MDFGRSKMVGIRLLMMGEERFAPAIILLLMGFLKKNGWGNASQIALTGCPLLLLETAFLQHLDCYALVGFNSFFENLLYELAFSSFFNCFVAEKLRLHSCFPATK